MLLLALNDETPAIEGQQQILHFLDLADKPVDHMFNNQQTVLALWTNFHTICAS
jgi:hypothetical protein